MIILEFKRTSAVTFMLLLKFFCKEKTHLLGEANGFFSKRKLFMMI